jgi:glycine C-acetyltransferase
MMGDAPRGVFQAVLREIADAGLTKDERIIDSAQGVEIHVGGRKVTNFCANNYLGLSAHPDVVAAAHRALDERGFGMSSVRFICGTQDLHKELETKLAAFVGMDDAILYGSCFDANGGLFETLLGEDDAVISDALNHASIIDGIRLCKAERLRYGNGDMNMLEEHLRATHGKRLRLIATDGVFSMDGFIAKLGDICDLADKYGAMVMVDDSHATGFMGRTGRGTHEHAGVMGRVDIITSTLGKALGGAAGGFTAARREVVDLLRQRSRPYLFSNALAPPIVGASIAVVDLLGRTTELRDRLMANAAVFRDRMTLAGFTIKPGIHPIVPIMLGEARLAQDLAQDLLGAGVYVIGFSFPVVPRGEARIRVQLSAGHTEEQILQAVHAFTNAGWARGIVTARRR